MNYAKTHNEDILRRANVRLCRLFTWSNYNGYGFQLKKCIRPPHLINLVESNSPAAIGGLKIYDVLLAINDKNVCDMRFTDVVNFIKSLQNSFHSVELLVVEQHIYEILKKKNITIDHSIVKIITTPRVMPKEYIDFPGSIPRTCLIYLKSKEIEFGFDIINGNDDIGLFIQEVLPDSPAYKAGLRKSDRIIALDGQCVEHDSSKILIEKLHKAASRRVFKLLVVDTSIPSNSQLHDSNIDQEDSYTVDRIKSDEECHSLNEQKYRIYSQNDSSNFNDDNDDHYIPFFNKKLNNQSEIEYDHCNPEESPVDDLLHGQKFTKTKSKELLWEEEVKSDYLEPSTTASQHNGNDMYKVNQRFFDVHHEPLVMMLPIEGYECTPLLPLSLAIENLENHVRNIKRNACIALERSIQPTDDLTADESAAIQIYTMEGKPGYPSLSMQLNVALRSEDRDRLVPYFPYFKLLLAALWKLKSTTRIVWRGVNGDVRKQYSIGKLFVWWGFSSCMESRDVLLLNKYLGINDLRTLFSIESTNGKMIHSHAYNKTENEILFLPSTQFQVIKHEKFNSNVYIVHLKEISPLDSDYSSILPAVNKTND